MKGGGKLSASLWEELGFVDRLGLLFHFPRRYEDRTKWQDPFLAEIGSPITLRGEIGETKFSRWRGGRICFEASLIPEGAIDSVRLYWFNMPYLKTYLTTGKEIVVHGKIQSYKQGLKLTHPEFEMIKPGENDFIHLDRITPIYPLSGKVKQRPLRTEMHKLLFDDELKLPEIHPVPDDLVDLSSALRNIHFPENDQALRQARRRLAFDELFCMQTVLTRRRRLVTSMTKQRPERTDSFVKRYLDSLPFEPTEAQQRAFRDIEENLDKSYPMNRLLQGDVGSGKTLVAAYALLLNAERGLDGALMAPTETLAEQHFQNLRVLEEITGIEVILWTASCKPSAPGQGLRPRIYVGTHALFQEGVDLGDLGLGVVDEQHKFGVLQRQNFLKKGNHPDLLVMTATPIPRTLCLTLYGDLDISVLNELPQGRKPIKTVIRKRKDLHKVWDYIRKTMKDGHQAYIIYPLLEESEQSALRSVKEAFAELKAEFGENEVTILHGKMKSDEKSKNMELFKSGQRRVLVATSVIEVGVDVPQATLIVIEHAERFGMAQLHQLRGRVGRSIEQSYCVLVSDVKSDESKERLEVLEQTTDGFVIAEEDFRLRGPGDVVGVQQSGLPRLRLAQVSQDMELLSIARREAEILLDEDPHLKNHPELRKRLSHFGMELGPEVAN